MGQWAKAVVYTLTDGDNMDLKPNTPVRPAERGAEGQMPRGPATFRGPGWAQQSTYEKYYNQLYKVYDLCLLKYNITDT